MHSLFIPLRPSSAPSARHPLGLSFIDGNQDFGSETAGLGSCMATRKCPRLRQGAVGVIRDPHFRQ
jgi:hypothetical protein